MPCLPVLGLGVRVISLYSWWREFRIFGTRGRRWAEKQRCEGEAYAEFDGLEASCSNQVRWSKVTPKINSTIKQWPIDSIPRFDSMRSRPIREKEHAKRDLSTMSAPHLSKSPRTRGSELFERAGTRAPLYESGFRDFVTACRDLRISWSCRGVLPKTAPIDRRRLILMVDPGAAGTRTPRRWWWWWWLLCLCHRSSELLDSTPRHNVAPHFRFGRGIRKHMRGTQIPFRNWMDLATNRTDWRNRFVVWVALKSFAWAYLNPVARGGYARSVKWEHTYIALFCVSLIHPRRWAEARNQSSRRPNSQ